jgi:excisionase family DNA binding protein
VSADARDIGLAADSRPLLTVEEAAQRLGIGRTTMYRLVSSGEVESVTLGRLRRVPSECLDEFVATLRRKQARSDGHAHDRGLTRRVYT